MGLEDLKTKLRESKAIKIENLNKSEINSFEEMMSFIDSEKPPEERTLDLMMKAKNPYAFLVGDSIVKISYSSRGNSERLEDILPKVIANQYMNNKKNKT